MRIYTAAYGYRDCDPIGHVAGKTAEECTRLLELALKDETERAEAECDSAHMCECGHSQEDHSEMGGACGWGPECDCQGWEPDGDSRYCQCDPDLWYVGPFEESCLDVVHNIYSKWDRHDFVRSLRDGPAYIPVN